MVHVTCILVANRRWDRYRCLGTYHLVADRLFCSYMESQQLHHILLAAPSFSCYPTCCKNDGGILVNFFPGPKRLGLGLRLRLKTGTGLKVDITGPLHRRLPGRLLLLVDKCLSLAVPCSPSEGGFKPRARCSRLLWIAGQLTTTSDMASFHLHPPSTIHHPSSPTLRRLFLFVCYVSAACYSLRSPAACLPTPSSTGAVSLVCLWGS